jgi:hypothetical protein
VLVDRDFPTACEIPAKPNEINHWSKRAPQHERRVGIVLFRSGWFVTLGLAFSDVQRDFLHR